VLNSLSSSIVVSVQVLVTVFAISFLSIDPIQSDYKDVAFSVFLSISFICIFAGNILAVFGNKKQKSIVFVQLSLPLILLGFMAADIVPYISERGLAFIPTFLMTVIITSVLTGVLFFMIGQFNLAFLGRCIPYSVVEGFLGGYGIYMVQKSILKLSNVSNYSMALFHNGRWKSWMAGIVLVLILILINKKYPRLPVLGLLLVIGAGIFYFVLIYYNIPLIKAIENGWSLKSFGTNPMWVHINLTDIANFDPSLFVDFSFSIISILCYSLLLVAVQFRALENVTKSSVDLDKAFKMSGFQNFISCLFGGTVCAPGISSTMLNVSMRSMGNFTRIILTLGVGILLFVACSKTFLSYFPLYILNIILLYTGAQIVKVNLFQSFFKYSLYDYICILLVALFTITLGFNKGLIVSILIMIISFSFECSRMEMIRNYISGRKINFKGIYSPKASGILKKEKEQLHCFFLGGPFFFGNSYKILMHVQSIIDNKPNQSVYFIFDFKNVLDIDTCGAEILKVISYLLNENRTILLSGMTRKHYTYLCSSFGKTTTPFKYFPDFDAAILYLENTILKKSGL